MPVTLNPSTFKYRDQQGTYQSIGILKGDKGAIDIVAPAYDSLTFPITAGQACIYNDLYYVAKQDITVQEVFDQTHWEIATVHEEISNKVGDVQINGTSVVQDGVANVPVASTSKFGTVKINTNYGIGINNNGQLALVPLQASDIKAGSDIGHALTPSQQHTSAFYGLSKVAGEDLKSDTVTVGTYPEKSKSAIHDMLNAPETVSGSTPSITAKSGVRYICGECSTLTIVVPATGIIDVVFESGSTPTVLTVTPPTGMTMQWPAWFDPTALTANTTYEINILDGALGTVMAWT